jgi:putative iron-regulated protein
MKSLLLASLLLLPFASANTAQAAAPEQVVKAYAERVYSDYSDSVTAAQKLMEAVEAFLADPTDANLDAAKTAWIDSRRVYSPTEAYRFYAGPIDSEEGPEGLINAWPLDEVYIDYVVGKPDAGIINNPKAYPVIDEDLLTSLNEKDGEKNISTGFHAIEFLLWGQDMNPNGPGRRPVKDYVIGVGKNAERRRAYLQTATALLIQHLDSVRNQWAPDAAYRKGFEGAPAQDSLRKILTGAFRLAGDELAHERIFVAYDTQQQEDEHSCFSDTTHLDILYNFEGIKRVLTAADGPLSLIEARDSASAQALLAALATTEAAVHSIPAPFDRAIYSPEGRAALLETVTQLEDLAKAIQASAAQLGITLE